MSLVDRILLTLPLDKREQKMHLSLTLPRPPALVCHTLQMRPPRGCGGASHQVPESRWSRVMEFHLLVMSMYRISTAAMDKLLLLSLQFLPRTGRQMCHCLAETHRVPALFQAYSGQTACAPSKCIGCPPPRVWYKKVGYLGVIRS